MSFLGVDRTTIPRTRWAVRWSIYRKFTKAWNTYVLRPNEFAYTPQLFLYRNGHWEDSEPIRQMFTALGTSYDSITSQSVSKDIEAIFLNLNAEKFHWDGTTYTSETFQPTPDFLSPTEDYLLDTLDKVYTREKVITVSVEYGGATRGHLVIDEQSYEVVNTQIVPVFTDIEIVQNKLMENPWVYLANSYHLENDSFEAGIVYETNKLSQAPIGVADVGSLNTFYGVFAALDKDEHNFEIINNAITGTRYFDTELLTTEVDGKIYRSVKFNLKFRYKGNIRTDKALVSEILKFYDYYTLVRYEPLFKLSLKDLVSRASNTKIKAVLFQLMYPPYLNIDGTFTSSLFESAGSTLVGTDDGTTRRLQLYSLKQLPASLMKKKDFQEMLSQCLEMNYFIRDKEWWEDILLIVLVWAVVVLSIYTAGTSNLFSGGVWSIIIAWGAVSGYIALGLTISLFIMSKITGIRGAQTAAAFKEVIVYLGYASLLLSITGTLGKYIQTLVRKSVEESAKEAIKSQVKDFASKESAKALEAEVSKQVSSLGFLDYTSAVFKGLVKEAVKTVSTLPSLANSTVKAMSYAVKGYSFYTDNINTSLKDDLNKAKAEAEELEESLDSYTQADPLIITQSIEAKMKTPDMINDTIERVETTVGRDSSYNKFSNFVGI